MLYYEWHLDTCEKYGAYTGNAVLVVKREHIVVDVGICKNTEDELHDLMDSLDKKHGNIYVTDNDTSLFDYEFISLELAEEVRVISEMIICT